MRDKRRAAWRWRKCQNVCSEGRSKMKRKREDISEDHALSESSHKLWHRSNDMDSPAITSITAYHDQSCKTDKEFSKPRTIRSRSVQHQVQTSEGWKALSQHLGPLGQEYIGDLLSGGGKNKIIDTVYGSLKNGIMMLGSKKFDVDSSNHIIIDGVRYAGTSGLY